MHSMNVFLLESVEMRDQVKTVLIKDPIVLKKFYYASIMLNAFGYYPLFPNDITQ